MPGRGASKAAEGPGRIRQDQGAAAQAPSWRWASSRQQGQQPGQHGELGERQQELRDKLQSLIDRFRIEGAEAPDAVRRRGRGHGRRQGRHRRGAISTSATQQQSLALDSLRKGAQSLAEQMEQSGEVQQAKAPAITAATRSAGPTARTGPISACR